MSKWRVAIDCGRWFLSEIGDQWGGGESFATEAAALEELRRIQFRAVESAESGLKIAKQRLVDARQELANPPKVSRMNRAAQAPGPAPGNASKGDDHE